MRSKFIILILTVCCVFFFTIPAFAVDSESTDHLYGQDDEHPWGGDNLDDPNIPDDPGETSYVIGGSSLDYFFIRMAVSRVCSIFSSRDITVEYGPVTRVSRTTRPDNSQSVSITEMQSIESFESQESTKNTGARIK